MTTIESICAQFDSAKLDFLPNIHHPRLTPAEIEAIIAAYINYQIWYSEHTSQAIEEFNCTPYAHTSDFHAPWLWLNNTVVTEKDNYYRESLKAYQDLMRYDGFLNAVNKNPHTNECGGIATFTESDADELISAFIDQHMAA